MRRTSSKNLFVSFALLAGLTLLFFSGSIWRYCVAMSFSEERLREYQELYQGETRGKVDPGTLPYRTGKLIVVHPSHHAVLLGSLNPTMMSWTQIQPDWRSRARELEPPRVHDAWYGLGSSLRATTPEEVDTVVFCAPKSKKVVSEDTDLFKTRTEGRAHYEILTVYDWKTRSFVGEYVVEGGSEPPDVGAVLAEMPLRAP